MVYIIIASILSFILINDYHTVKIRTSFVATIPVFMYSVVYIISAIMIGEENGGWRDHYHLEELMPWPFVAIIILAITVAIANLIRWGHNSMHRWEKRSTRKFYQSSPAYALPTIEEAIVKLAREYKKYYRAGDVVIPKRIIVLFEQKYESGKPLEELCQIYVKEYLK